MYVHGRFLRILSHFENAIFHCLKGSIVPNVQLPSTGEAKNGQQSQDCTGKILTATDSSHLQPKTV